MLSLDLILVAAVCFVVSCMEKKMLLKNSQGVCNGMRGDYGSCIDSTVLFQFS